MKAVFIFLAVVLSARPLPAQQTSAIILGASTVSATAEAGYRFGPNFGLRGTALFGSAKLKSKINDVPLASASYFDGIGILADIYFSDRGRFTTGSFAPNHGADVSIMDGITIEGASSNNMEIVRHIGSNDQIPPIMVIGYEKIFRNNWGVSADLGAMYMGGFSIGAINSSAQLDKVSELEDTNTALGQINILPFANLGVSFAF